MCFNIKPKKFKQKKTMIETKKIIIYAVVTLKVSWAFNDLPPIDSDFFDIFKSGPKFSKKNIRLDFIKNI
jgi:hypothetical protein